MKEQDEILRARRRKNGFGNYGEKIANERKDKNTIQPGLILPYQKAYCEHCKKHVPISEAPKNRKKGWKCNDCLGAEK